MKTFVILPVLLLAACAQLRTPDYTSLVDPMIGTGGHGHTYPGASVPFGMVQLSPDTRKDNWDACSGYHYSDSTIFGFSHTHLSGTGVGDYGDIRIMPSIGPLNPVPGTVNVPGSGYLSRFRHENEIAEPGYYEVFLDDCQVLARMTATKRCGFHQYIFPEASRANFIIDLTESVTSDDIIELFVDLSHPSGVSGFRRTRGWASNQVVYFWAIFSKPMDDAGIIADGAFRHEHTSASGKDLKAYVSFSTSSGEEVMIKVGISAVSIENARKNLEAEIKEWDFDGIRSLAGQAWNDELSKIEVSGGNETQRKAFYTALYHSFLAPNLFTDVDGSYLGHDGKIYKARDFETYTVFSLWDTYRALHPLMTLVQPERTNDFIRTMLDIREKGGLLPVWELAGNETYCMIGYHAVPVIADAIVKGFRGFDVNKALEAMKNSASQDHFGLSSYRKYGFIPSEEEGESVSKTLEYAYDDWCIAQTAKLLKNEDDYRTYLQRAQYYKNLFDPDTRFIRGKRNNLFAVPFDPAEVNFMLTEANTWQYTFYVPQDISGLIGLMGGDNGFTDKLDSLFNISSDLTGREQSDITGLIGQYAHGNEPSHHMAYLYDYAGKPYKTQAMVRKIMDELYGDGPEGLCGNEDCGQMSAWYVLSAIGFYPVTPGSVTYAIGSPLFDEVSIHLSNGKAFRITANDNDIRNVYIRSAELNGKPYQYSYITHSQILKGGELEFEMDREPNTAWGSDPGHRPVSAITEHLITPVPFFSTGDASTFRDSIHVSIRGIDGDADIYYSIGDTSAGSNYFSYSRAIKLDKTEKITAWALAPGKTASRKLQSVFRRMHHGWTVGIANPYSPQYTAGGDLALVDGQSGGKNFRTGAWQGYQGVDLDITIDLGQVRHLSTIGIRFLEDQKSWIFLPLEIRIMTAMEPGEFQPLDVQENRGPERNDEPHIKSFDCRKSVNARYVRILARNRNFIPSWHPGAGHRAWIFADEITIK